MDRINWKKKKRRTKKRINLSTINYKVVVFRSNKHIYGQVLDTEKGSILFSSSSLDNELKKEVESTDSGKIGVSKIVAKKLSDKMKENKIKAISFDRNGYVYHGRIKAFAEELRSNGIKF